jgi:hypothetical protein
MKEAKQKSNESQPQINNVTKKKKGNLIIRILKWIVKGILTLLLILSIIFQAPWKIITLLAVFFVACFVLPKRTRKYFWLSVGTALVILLVWIFLPEDDTRWQPYTFDEELAILEAKYAVPDEDNAALIYDSLLEDYDGKSMYPKFLDSDLNRLTYSEQWTSQEYPELAEWIEEQQDTIQTLFQAVKKEKCKFPINVQIHVTDKMEINRLSALRSWALLLVRAANNDMAEGRTEKAIEKYLCAIGLTNHLNQQPEITYLIMSYTPQQQTLIALNRILINGEPTAEQLQLISDTVGGDLQDNWCSNFSRWFETNVLFWKNAFGLFYEVNPAGQIRFSRNPAPVISDLFYSRRISQHLRNKQANKIYVVPAWLFLPSTPQKAAEPVEAIMDKYSPMTQPDFNWNLEPNEPELPFELNYWYMVKSVIIKENNTEQLYHSFHDIYLEQITLRRGIRLLVAIRQYKNENGKWPPDLDSIKTAAPAEAFLDPVSGKPLQYENYGQRFSLYGEKTNVWPR